MNAEKSYIIEFTRLGDYVKATAVDPATLEERSVIMPAKGVTEDYMKKTAIRMLERKQRERRRNGDSDNESSGGFSGGTGIIV